jgi:hypothetical protein
MERKNSGEERVLVGNEEGNGQGSTDEGTRNVVLLDCVRIWKMRRLQFSLLCCFLIVIIHFSLDPRKYRSRYLFHLPPYSEY